MSAAVEIRPGSVREKELASLELVLTPKPATVQRSKVSGVPRLIGCDGTVMDVPAGIFELLVRVVDELRAGNGVSVVALHAELTTVEAAEILNISRPHLIKQLEAGELAYRMVGSHRRIRLADVLAYRDRTDAQAREALDELTRKGEELGLYD